MQQQPLRNLLGHDSEDDGEIEESYPFTGIDKVSVLQQCRCFNDITIDVRRCLVNMVKILYLLHTGTHFTTTEATDVFFSATKLFQSDNPKLHRMLFIFLRDMAPHAEQVFIASSSLVKDIKGGKDIYRANAIRTLRKVLDSSVINTVERYIKEAVVDKNNNFVAAALVTGIHLAYTHPDIVRHWGVEVNEALKNRGGKVQYHALALLHKLRKNDRLSVLKFVQLAQGGGPIRSPLALCLLIRMCAELLQEDFNYCGDLYKFLITNVLHHSADMVVIEAANAVCSLRDATSKEVMPAVLAISPYLNSHKPTLRQTTISILSDVAAVHPSVVAPISNDIEALVNDPNKNIATLAISTLLKVGNEFTVERLIHQITGPTAMGNFNDDSKALVIESMRVVNDKMPNKYPVLLDFLFTTLVGDSTEEFKNTVIELMIHISNNNPAAREPVLKTLARFIEDCEYTNILKRVLCMIGEQGPYTLHPGQFIRYICNHSQLESPVVRAVAVTTLAKFGAVVPELRKSVSVLLRRTMSDSEDEVRDRAVFYYNLLSTGDEVIIRSFINDVSVAIQQERSSMRAELLFSDSNGFNGNDGNKKLFGSESASLAQGSSSGGAYPYFAGNETGNLTKNTGAALGFSEPSLLSGHVLSPSILELRGQLCRIPQLRELGEPLRTTDPLMLTEADNEYVVSISKQIYIRNIVLQFKVTNTIDNMILLNFNILADLEDLEGSVTPLFAVPIAALGPHESGYAYVVLKCEEKSFPNGMIRSGCSFSMVDGTKDDLAQETAVSVAPVIEGDAEEYPLDEFALNVCDYITPFALTPPEFRCKWDSLKSQSTVDHYNLTTMNNLAQAVHAVVDFFGMHVVSGPVSEKINGETYTVDMAGAIADNNEEGEMSKGTTVVLISARVYLTSEGTVALELSERGGEERLRAFLSRALVS